MPSTDPADNGHGDPFPDRPPQYVRALLYEYRFRPGNIRADRAVVGAPVGGALFPAGQPGRLPSSRAARNWAASRDRRKSLTLTARRQLRRRFAGVRRGMLNRHRSWGCRSELCLEMSHLNEDPLVSPRSALIFRAQILGKSPSGRAKFNRKVRYPAGVDRVREFVPRHRSGPAS